MQRFMTGIRGLTPRQLAGAGAVLVLVVAAVTAGATGRVGWAVALLAMLGAVLFAASLQSRRRLERLAQLVGHEGRETRRAITEVKQTLGDATKARIVTAEREEHQHRQLLAAVENQRLATDDARQQVVATVAQQGRMLGRLQSSQVGEVEALLQLFSDFRPRAPMPPSGGFALNPSGLLQVLQLIRQEEPKLVLELGSGTSSVWLAYALEAIGGRLVTVDHDPRYADRTRTLLAMHGLDEVAQVRQAPLMPVELAGEKFPWYDTESFGDLSGVGLVLIDGPPKSAGPQARYPALPVLEALLAPAATVVLDDATRPEEDEVLARWLNELPGLSRRPVVFDRQAVLSYRR